MTLVLLAVLLHRHPGLLPLVILVSAIAVEAATLALRKRS